MNNYQLQWRRNKASGGLELWVYENNKWNHYSQAKFYTPDALFSSNSGFATAQRYLSLGATYINTTMDYEIEIEKVITAIKDINNICQDIRPDWGEFTLDKRAYLIAGVLDIKDIKWTIDVLREV